MDLYFTEADLRFRDEVRSFIAAALTPDLREAGRNCAGIYCEYPEANRWHRILAAQGWSVPAWPIEYGGTGWSPLQQYICDLEMAMAGAPPLTPNATHMVAPAIMAFGTDAQKSHFLPRIRSGDDWWAQGYSEPGSGSDLASLRCAAVRDGDHYVLNGSKIWTTHAHFSNRIFCLVRTTKADKPQKGISFLLFDLDIEGVEIRPIVSTSGEHELNEVFFTNARVPVSALLGREDDGWTVAKYLLQHERAITWSPLLRARLTAMRAKAAVQPGDTTERLIDDPGFAAQLAEVDIRLSVLEISELRMLGMAAAGGPVPGQTSSMMKVLGTELRQALTELAVQIEGRAVVNLTSTNAKAEVHTAAALGTVAMTSYLNDRAASIYAGANEVQRNIIANWLLK